MARPLPDPVLFLDECLGTKDVADALRSKGATVEVLLDHFPSGCPDQEWLPAVPRVLNLPEEEGLTAWVALTKDNGFGGVLPRGLRSNGRVWPRSS